MACLWRHLMLALGILLSASFPQVQALKTVEPPPQYEPCKGVEHSSSFTHTCCKGAMLPVGIDFQKHWDKCFVSNPEEKHISQALERIFECIVKASKPSKMSLSGFGSAMKKYYPKSIKDAISLEIKKNGTKTTDLNMIRIAYHEIEYKVCTGDTSATPIQWDRCSKSEDIGRENYHLRGDCCQNKHLPIRLTFLRREPTPELQNKTRALALGTGYLKSFGEIQKFQAYQMTRTFEESDFQQMCFTGAIFRQYFNFDYDPFYKKAFDYLSLLSVAAHWFPAPLQDEVVAAFQDTQALDKEVDDTVFANVDRIAESEFITGVDKTRLYAVLLNCERFNVAVRLMEKVILKHCRTFPESTDVPAGNEKNLQVIISIQQN